MDFPTALIKGSFSARYVSC